MAVPALIPPTPTESQTGFQVSARRVDMAGDNFFSFFFLFLISSLMQSNDTTQICQHKFSLERLTVNWEKIEQCT